MPYPSPRRLAALSIAVALALVSSAPAAAAGSTWPTLAQGRTPFAFGVNYEGPPASSWVMWDPANFDAALIDADFARAQQAGFQVMRLFVQAPLEAEIRAGRWSSLDTVAGLADKHHLRLIMSLHDDGQRDLARAADIDRRIALHFRGRTTILGYDLKNEPHLADLELDTFPSTPPLQTQTLIDHYGEQMSHDDVAALRAGPDGAKQVPASLDEYHGWMYENNVLLYRAMLADAGQWMRAHGAGATIVGYLASPDGQVWQPLLQVLDRTLSQWIAPQLAAIRSADPAALVTLDQVDPVLASLPANDVLSYQEFHRYASPTTGGLIASLATVKAEQAAHPKSPLVLGEFGVPTDSNDPRLAAVADVATYLGVYGQSGAGALLWMLNDLPPGFNMTQRTYGAFNADGSSKPVADATTQLSAYLQASAAAPGQLTPLDDPSDGLAYAYQAADAYLVGGQTVSNGPVQIQADQPTQVFVTWTNPAVMRVWASDAVTVTLDVAALTGRRWGGPIAVAGGPTFAPGDGGTLVAAFTQSGVATVPLGGPAPAKPAG